MIWFLLEFIKFSSGVKYTIPKDIKMLIAFHSISKTTSNLCSIWIPQKTLKMEGTVFTPSLEGMKHVKSDRGELLTKPFLDVCKHVLPILGASSL